MKVFKINKFYEYYVKYNKFYNKFYTSSTQVLRVLRPGHTFHVPGAQFRALA